MKTRWASRGFRDFPGDCWLWDQRPSIEALCAMYRVSPGEIVFLQECMTQSLFQGADLWPEIPEPYDLGQGEARPTDDPPPGRPRVYVCEVLPET